MKAALRHIHKRTVAGATLLCVGDHRLPYVHFYFAIRYGAMHDPPGKAGLTRLMMEMLLRGTLLHDRASWHQQLEMLGSSASCSVGSELAVLQGAALKRNLTATLALIGEALTQPAFSPAQLALAQREAMADLFALRDDDDDVAQIFLRREIYAGHGLARLPAGEYADLPSITGADLQAAHARLVQPQQLIAAFAGDVTADELEKLLLPILTHLPAASTNAAPAPALVSGRQTAPDLSMIIVDKPERTQVQIRLARMGLDGCHQATEALWLGMMAFGGTFSARFCQEVRDKRGWSYVAHAEFHRRSLNPAPIVLVTAPAQQDAIACLKLELELFNELACGNLASSALSLARDYLLNRFPFSVATAFDMIAAAVQHELLHQPPEHLLGLPQRLQALDLGDIPALLQRHLQPPALTAVMVADAATLLPQLEKELPHATLKVVDFRDGLPANTSEEAL